MYRFLRNVDTPDPNYPDIVLPATLQNIETGGVFRLDPLNRDYQDYLLWVAEGNTATPAGN